MPEASVLIADTRPFVRDQAGELGLPSCPPSQLRGLQSPLVVDSSAEPRGLKLALKATAPDGLCSCAGTLHASARIPASLMFGRNVSLSIARSHVRGVIPAVLDLVAAGRIAPQRVTSTVAPFDEAPTVLRDHLLGADTKTVLVRSL